MRFHRNTILNYAKYLNDLEEKKEKENIEALGKKLNDLVHMPARRAACSLLGMHKNESKEIKKLKKDVIKKAKPINTHILLHGFI